MGNIVLHDSPAAFAEELRGRDEAFVLLEEVGKQSAINAISFLLKNGCTEKNATKMLSDLRMLAAIVRDERRRRGQQPLFPIDQTGFQ